MQTTNRIIIHLSRTPGASPVLRMGPICEQRPDHSQTDKSQAESSWSESLLGGSELLVLAAVIVWSIMYPSMLMLPVLVLTGFVLAGIEVLADRAWETAQARHPARIRRQLTEDVERN
ncbi:MAG: hypothetical protein ABSH20_20615 [Tepidisphaeraceae bacterium]|jgi:Flp pilus assembly protein TadB